MADNDDRVIPDLFNEGESKEANLDEDTRRERSEILRNVVNATVGTLQHRVAWILNHFPECRDSDITCQIRYWHTFQSDLFDGHSVAVADLYRLTRLTSISRARAKIQNTYRLFLGSPEVRRRRGQLSEEEKEKAIEEQPTYPVYAVYADESGKTGDHLIVGSLWIIDGINTLKLVRAVGQWREVQSFQEELHFQSITEAKLPIYRSLLDLLHEWAATLGFKALSVPRKGLGDVRSALVHLYYYLLVHGVEHEHGSGRAPLPRTIQLWKDAEEEGFDRLLLKQVAERLNGYATLHLGGKLVVDEMRAVDSKQLVLLQLADLFTSSINRALNAKGKRTSPKDRFANALLQRFGLAQRPHALENLGDCAVHVSL